MVLGSVFWGVYSGVRWGRLVVATAAEVLALPALRALPVRVPSLIRRPRAPKRPHPILDPRWWLRALARDRLTEVTEFERSEQVRQGPREGVFVHGLFLDGAAWSRGEGTLVESAPKKLFAGLPVLFVTAVTKAQKKNRSGGERGRTKLCSHFGSSFALASALLSDYGPYGGFECPCHKYPNRTDRNFIFLVTMASRDHKPIHWTLRGVGLLCSKD